MNYIVYLKTHSGEQNGLFCNLAEDEARDIYNAWSEDPECIEVLVINGDIVASSSDPLFEELTLF